MFCNCFNWQFNVIFDNISQLKIFCCFIWSIFPKAAKITLLCWNSNFELFIPRDPIDIIISVRWKRGKITFIFSLSWWPSTISFLPVASREFEISYQTESGCGMIPAVRSFLPVNSGEAWGPCDAWNDNQIRNNNLLLIQLVVKLTWPIMVWSLLGSD